jgi:glycosyltransferase involved in cell wall biosynthesis
VSPPPARRAAGLVAVVLPPREGFSPDAAGAIGLLVQRLGVARSSFDTVVIGGSAATPPFAAPRFLPIRGATLCGRPLNALYAWRVARRLRRLRPALVEVHNRPRIALALARALPATPVLLVLHNDPQAAHGARSAAERAGLLRRLAAVVVVSDWMRARFMAGLPDGTPPPALLPNSIDRAALPPPLPDTARAPEILFAGRLVHNKGADSFVAAAAQALPALPGWRATAIGADGFAAASPDTEFLRTLRHAARDAGVTLAGYRSHADTMAAMARAAIVVVPSRWEEPFGLVALEALANGAALICTRRGALPEVAGDAAVYADPDDPAALAAAIVALARDPARRAVLAAAGRARARAFDVAEAADRLDALRRQVLAPPSA